MGRPQKWKPEKAGTRYTIKSLRLDLKSATEGKTWLLLPQGYRDRASGSTYPLPSNRQDLQKLAAIPIPQYSHKQDCGCYYLRRALREWKRKQERHCSAINDIGRREDQIERTHDNYVQHVRKLRADAREQVDIVKQEAVKAVASLTDLFSLGRQGLEGQMKAHLDGKKWKKESIDAAGFRQCFRLVSQAVKGLGLPNPQKKDANSAVLEQVADALRQTQEALAMNESTALPDTTSSAKPEDQPN